MISIFNLKEQHKNSYMKEKDFSRQIETIKKDEITARLREFRQIYQSGSEEELFAELCFCILTPQSRAKLCWDAITRLSENGLLFEGCADHIVQLLDGVRFKANKAKYIVAARESFTNRDKISIRPSLERFNDVYEIREWLAQNIKGIGFKEASHFLRNIGFGDSIAILDRHILRNLKEYGVIANIPKSMTRKRYMEIEKKMLRFAKQVSISVAELDLLLWCKETGYIFK